MWNTIFEAESLRKDRAGVSHARPHVPGLPVWTFQFMKTFLEANASLYSALTQAFDGTLR